MKQKIISLLLAAASSTLTMQSMPFVEHFVEDKGPAIILDSNGDGNTWHWKELPNDDNEGAMVYGTGRYDADDWMFIPSLDMTAGREYVITVSYWVQYTYYPETLEIKIGNAATAEAMTSTILEPSTISETYYGKEPHVFRFTAPADGEYVLGFHCTTSSSTGSTLYVDDISVEAGILPTAPGEVTDAKAEPGKDGALEAIISFTAPAVTVDGSALTSLDKIEISRDGQTVATLTDVKPGEAATYTDKSPANGFNSYKITAFNSDGNGKPVELSVFCGTDAPLTVTNARYDDSGATLKAVWDPVSTTGVNGGYVDPAKTAYIIYRPIPNPYWLELEQIAETEPGVNSYDFGVAAEEGDQRTVEYYVSAKNAIDESETEMIGSDQVMIIGASYPVPFRENIAGATLSHYVWEIDKSGYYTEPLAFSTSDTYDKERTSGTISWTSKSYDDYIAWGTGKIAVADAENPVLYFAAKAVGQAATAISVKALKNSTEIVDNLAGITPAGDWTVYSVDLSALKGSRYASLLFEFKADDENTTIYLDDINVADRHGNDLAVSVSVPPILYSDLTTKATLTVRNLGTESANGFTGRILLNDTEIGAVTSDEELKPFADKVIELDITPTVFAEAGKREITAEVSYPADENTENNSVLTDCEIRLSGAVPVEETVGTAENGVYAATWKQPANPFPVIFDDFESYNWGTIDGWGDWTTIDRDGAFVRNVFTEPLPHQNEPYAFLLFNLYEFGALSGDLSVVERWSHYAGHSGYQSLFSTWSSTDEDYADLDNWLVSPTLSGAAQTISFWARNHDYTDELYPETLEVLYSTTGTEWTDFTKLTEVTVNTSEWTNITAELPEGATRFAIRQTTDRNNANILMIDDITYTASFGEIDHYNIYVNRKLVAQPTEPAYTFATRPGNDDTVAVTAVYKNGRESTPVAIEFPQSGITTVSSSDAQQSFDIYTLTGIRVRSNATDFSGLPAGIYIGGGKKVVVR